MRTLAFDVTGGLGILAHGASAPSDAEWSGWVDALATSRTDRVLVWTDGPGPDASQRRKVTDRVGKSRAAVMTESVFARPLATALRWMGVDIQVFRRTELDRALQYLEVGTTDHELVLRASLRLRVEAFGARMHVEALDVDAVRDHLARSGQELLSALERAG